MRQLEFYPGGRPYSNGDLSILQTIPAWIIQAISGARATTSVTVLAGLTYEAVPKRVRFGVALMGNTLRSFDSYTGANPGDTLYLVEDNDTNVVTKEHNTTGVNPVSAFKKAKIQQGAPNSGLWIRFTVGDESSIPRLISNNVIHDQTIRGEKLVNGTITANKLAANAVTNDKIANEAVLTRHINEGAVETRHIKDGQITKAKLVNNGLMVNNWSGFRFSKAAAANFYVNEFIDCMVDGSGFVRWKGYMTLNINSGIPTYILGNTTDEAIPANVVKFPLVAYISDAVHAKSAFVEFDTDGTVRLKIDTSISGQYVFYFTGVIYESKSLKLTQN